MKKQTSRRASSRDLRGEYEFDYRRSRSNRFAARMRDGSIAVVLEPDVASVFRSSEDVNALLRSVISSYPAGGRRKVATGRRSKTA